MKRIFAVSLTLLLAVLALQGCLPQTNLEQNNETIGMTDNPLLSPPEGQSGGIYGLVTVPSSNAINPRATVVDQTGFGSEYTLFSGEKFVARGSTDRTGKFGFREAGRGVVYTLTSVASGGFEVRSYLAIPEDLNLFQQNVHFAGHALYHLLQARFEEHREWLEFLPPDETTTLSDWLHGAIEGIATPPTTSSFFEGGGEQTAATALFEALVSGGNSGLAPLLDRVELLARLETARKKGVSDESEEIAFLASYLSRMGFTIENSAAVPGAFPRIRQTTITRLYSALRAEKTMTLSKLQEKMARFGILKARTITDPLTRSVLPDQYTNENVSLGDLTRALGTLPDLNALVPTTNGGSAGAQKLGLLIQGFSQARLRRGSTLYSSDTLDLLEILTMSYVFLADTHTDSIGSFLVGLPTGDSRAGEDFFDRFIAYLLAA